MSDNLKFSQDYLVYKTKKEGVYPIKESEWERIKRYIKELKPNKSHYQVISSASFGIFGSALLSLIGFYTSSNVENFILITCWVLTIASLLIAIGFNYLDNQQKTVVLKNADDILREMEEIEKSFEKEG